MLRRCWRSWGRSDGAATGRAGHADAARDVYLGLPGEPALGSATYMHRFSGLANPEAPIGHHWLDPEEDVRRTTASVTYNRAFSGGNWQSTLAGGRNAPTHKERGGGEHPHATDAFLLDSAVQVGRNTIFGRVERVDKDELFADDESNPLAERVFDVGKLSIGGYYSAPVGQLSLDVGGLMSGYALPRALEPAYGRAPKSAMLFARVRVVGC